jgi:hypothetical protein
MTSTTQSSFSVACNTSGNAVSQTQNTITSYYVNGVLVGQDSAATSLTLAQFQSIVAALTGE